MNYDNLIAIDPDTDKSGVAFLELSSGKMETSVLGFAKLLEYLKFAKQTSEQTAQTVLIIIEAGWMNAKSNFHGGNNNIGQRIAKNVGANHEVGRKIAEMCEYYGLEVKLQKPLTKKKDENGKRKKITTEELNEKLIEKGLSPIIGRCNQDMRDSVLILLNNL